MAATTKLCYYAMLTAILFAAVVFTAARPAFGQSLVEIYSNPDFQITGVTVSKGETASLRISPLVRPLSKRGGGNNVRWFRKNFPDEYWNRWSGRASETAKQFVCVQSMVADDRNVLWVVDPAAPLLGPVVEGGAKLVAIDLSTNRVKRVYKFGPDVVKSNTYLNDVRIDDSRHTAYMNLRNNDSGKIVSGLNDMDIEVYTSARTLRLERRQVFDHQLPGWNQRWGHRVPPATSPCARIVAPKVLSNAVYCKMSSF